MNAVTTTQDTKTVALYSGASLVPRNMDEAIRLAEFMCRARTLPKHLWDSPGDCLMVVELAMRWGMSPFAVAQATSVIAGKQMIEGKLVAAACESVGAIVGQFDYSFTGEGDGRSITVTATRRGETNPRTVTVKLADAKTANQMWIKQPDQQLVYHGARVWARRWTPAVILGVYSREEMGLIIEGEALESTTETPPAPPDLRVAINKSVPLNPVPNPAPRPPRQPRTIGQLLDAVRIGLNNATSRVEVDRILDSEDVLKLRANVAADSPAILRLDEMRDEALERFPPLSDEDEALEDVEIIGADKVMSG